jgi:hypothetical protein
VTYRNIEAVFGTASIHTTPPNIAVKTIVKALPQYLKLGRPYANKSKGLPQSDMSLSNTAIYNYLVEKHNYDAVEISKIVTVLNSKLNARNKC